MSAAGNLPEGGAVSLAHGRRKVDRHASFISLGLMATWRHRLSYSYGKPGNRLAFD